VALAAQRINIRLDAAELARDSFELFCVGVSTPNTRNPAEGAGLMDIR
jgi:hypothetical protein